MDAISEQGGAEVSGAPVTAADALAAFVDRCGWNATSPEADCTVVAFGQADQVPPTFALVFWTGPSSGEAITTQLLVPASSDDDLVDELVVLANAWNSMARLTSAYVAQDDASSGLVVQATVLVTPVVPMAHLHACLAAVIEEFELHVRWRGVADFAEHDTGVPSEVGKREQGGGLTASDIG